VYKIGLAGLFFPRKIAPQEPLGMLEFLFLPVAEAAHEKRHKDTDNFVTVYVCPAT
jgi:hypothetical protein